MNVHSVSGVTDCSSQSASPFLTEWNNLLKDHRCPIHDAFYAEWVGFLSYRRERGVSTPRRMAHEKMGFSPGYSLTTTRHSGAARISVVVLFVCHSRRESAVAGCPIHSAFFAEWVGFLSYRRERGVSTPRRVAVDDQEVVPLSDRLMGGL